MAIPTPAAPVTVSAQSVTHTVQAKEADLSVQITHKGGTRSFTTTVPLTGEFLEEARAIMGEIKKELEAAGKALEHIDLMRMHVVQKDGETSPLAKEREARLQALFDKVIQHNLMYPVYLPQFHQQARGNTHDKCSQMAFASPSQRIQTYNKDISAKDVIKKFEVKDDAKIRQIWTVESYLNQSKKCAKDQKGKLEKDLKQPGLTPAVENQLRTDLRNIEKWLDELEAVDRFAIFAAIVAQDATITDYASPAGIQHLKDAAARLNGFVEKHLPPGKDVERKGWKPVVDQWKPHLGKQDATVTQKEREYMQQAVMLLADDYRGYHKMSDAFGTELFKEHLEWALCNIGRGKAGADANFLQHPCVAEFPAAKAIHDEALAWINDPAQATAHNALKP